MALPKPDPPRLHGATPDEKEEARGPTFLRLEWDLVPGAAGYEIRVDGGTPQPAQSGDRIGPFDPNTLHEAAIRALDGMGGSSSWSDPFTKVTRPQTPPDPQRVPLDLSLWGIALAWSVPEDFPGADKAQIQLLRSFDGSQYTVFASKSLREILVVDDTDPQMRPKWYRLRTVVLRADVLGDNLQDDNRSFPGPLITEQYPLTIKAIPAIQPKQMNTIWMRQYRPPSF